MDLHNYGVLSPSALHISIIMGIHNSIMDLHNSIMDLNNGDP